MIKKFIPYFFMLFVFSCSGIEFVLKENSLPNQFKDKTIIVFNGDKEERFTKEIYAFFGDNTDGDFILITSFSEKKENRLVKQNQVAEKIDYEIAVLYEIFYKNQDCKLFNKKIVSKFSFVPKSFGYNFGTDRSLDKLYSRSIRRNIQNFIDLAPEGVVCL